MADPATPFTESLAGFAADTALEGLPPDWSEAQCSRSRAACRVDGWRLP
jgi:hypothetical protein